MRFVEFNDNQLDLIQAFRDFLPLAMDELKLSKLPKIKLEKEVEDPEQPTFGRFENDSQIIYLGISNRHVIDILRTLAHELVHYKQFLNGEIDQNSGDTGSPIENQAHAVAGVIMRHFNKQHPSYFKTKPLELSENFADGRNPQDREQGMQWERQLQRSWAPQAAAYMAKVVKQSFNSLYPDVPIRVKREDIFIMATTDPKARITDLDIDVFNQRNNPNWECNFIVSPLFHMADKTPYLELMVESAASGQYKGVWKLIAQGWARYANSQLQKTGAKEAVFSVDEDHSDAWAAIASQAGLKYIVHNRGFKEDIEENFADGKNPGRKGLAKRSGVNTKASISSLRKTAKNSSGEKARMAHWLANMKAGKAKKK